MQEKKQKTIGDYAYEHLREDIICLNLAPGERLSEVQLAQKYGIGRAPVRKALNRLEQEGLVCIKPQFGTIVSDISIRRGQDICDVRLLLECHAARIAAQKIGDDRLFELQRAFDRLERMDARSEEYKQYVSEVDIQLHGAISESCGNAVIPEIIESYQPEIQRIRYATRTWANRLEPSKSEMEKIFAALKRREPEVAAGAMEEHLRNLKAAIGSLPPLKKGG